MNADLNDSLDDIFGGPASSDVSRNVTPSTHASQLSPDLKRAAETGGFFQQCGKCGGSGRFGNFGRCFACAGKGGKRFKTSPADRAKKREQVVARKVRNAEESWQLFVVASSAIAAWIEAKRSTFGFAQAMFEAVTKWGDLTDKQRAAVERCIASDAAKAQERAARAASAPACHRTLTNDESIAAGIGPICAERFGF